MTFSQKINFKKFLVVGTALISSFVLQAKETNSSINASPAEKTQSKGKTQSQSYFTFDTWVKTTHVGDYFSLTREPDGKIAHWKMLNVTVGGVDRLDETIYKSVGNDQFSIPNFGAEDMKKGLIKNTMFPFYSKHLPRVRPIITRVGCNITEDGTFITCSIGGEYYAKGGTELIPQIFYSKTGEQDTFENLVVKKMDLCVVPGDLEYWVEKSRKDNKQIRFETATVLKIKDKYHYYVQSPGILGCKIALLQAKDFKSSWHFYGTTQKPIDLAASLKNDVSWLFFSILPIGERGYLLVGGNKWPAHEIYGAISQDGIKFRMLSNEPILTLAEIQKVDPSAKFMKSFRGLYNEDGSFDVGISVDTRQGQVMFASKTKFPDNPKKN